VSDVEGRGTSRADETARLKSGLAFWLLVSAFLAYPELKAAFWKPRPPWVTISHTIGHLEERWHVLAPIVVGTIVVVAVHTYRTRHPDEYPYRTPGGRLIPAEAPPAARTPPQLAPFIAYAIVTAGVVAGTSYYVSTRDDVVGTFAIEYTMYGSLAVLCIVVPNAFALLRSRDVPFPTHLKTLELIEERSSIAGLALVAALGILILHLGLYPWPGSLPPPSPHP
jgi:hypothetical protein